MSSLQDLLAKARAVSEAPTQKVVVIQRETFDALIAVAQHLTLTRDSADVDVMASGNHWQDTLTALDALTAALTAALGESK